MALFKPFKGSRISLDAQEKHDGYVYFCTDDGSFHIDYVDADGNLQRKQINAKEAESLVGYDIATILISSDAEIPTSKAVMDALDLKVEKVDGSRLITATEAEKINSIETAAQVNIIESITLSGVSLDILNKNVDIPVATMEALGLVKSSNAENKITVVSDGTMEVNSINVNKLVQTDGEELILNGGVYTV